MHEPLPECQEIFKNLHDTCTRIEGQTAAIREAVLGNGNPKDSIASRITRLETFWKLGVIVLALATLCVSVYAAVIR